METRIIHDMEFVLDPFEGKEAYVHISVNGKYYYSETFPTLEDARRFFYDPFAKDRKHCEEKRRREKMLSNDTTYLDRWSGVYRRSS